MAPRTRTIVAFDLYGTLLSTASLSDILSSTLSLQSPRAIALSAHWRTLHLEYSWRCTCMSPRNPPSFRSLALASLPHALADFDLPVASQETLERVMRVYDEGIPMFPDAITGLRVLRAARKGNVDRDEREMKAVVFSNGSEDSITAALQGSDIQGMLAEGTEGKEGWALDGVVSVAAARVFKPGAQAYEHLVQSVGQERRDDIWLVSSNPFDVVGALGAGLKTAWVNREGKSWRDGLGEALGLGGPTIIVRGVDEAVERILGSREEM